MIGHGLLLCLLSILIQPVLGQEQAPRTDDYISSSSLCAINRPGFGQLERVQLTSHSIEIQFKNVFSNFKCSFNHIYASIINMQTDEVERTIDNIQSNTILAARLLPNHNYSIAIRLSDGKSLRILPMHVFQTLASAETNTVTLSTADLLLVEQIESFVFPHTHIYIVTLPSDLQRTTILGNISLAYRMNDTQYEYHQIVKPLDQNKISRLGRLAKRAIFFAIDLPSNYAGSIEYSSYIRLFLPNDARQSIVDYPVHVQSPPSIVVDFLPLSSSETLGRAVRVSIRQLCASYIEVKAIVYSDLVTKKAVSREQCDINKNSTSPLDIMHGQCTVLFDQLQPEQNYTLSIRATCPLATSSPSASYVYYDEARFFAFQTSSGLPDSGQVLFSFHQHDRTLLWTMNKTSNQSQPSYRGPDYYYELFANLENNWTLIYHGNETYYQLPTAIGEKTNATFRLYTGNRYGRNEKTYAQVDIDLQHSQQWTFDNPVVIFTILISVLLLLLFGFLFIGCYVRNKNLYGKLKQKYCQNGDISDKELEHLRSLTYANTALKDNVLYTWNHTPTHVDLNKLPRIERAQIKLDRLIGKGAFGEVYAGTMINDQSIAVKTLLSSATPSQRVDFLKEAIIMHQFQHEHIVELLGVCFHSDQQPQYLVLELMEQGDLQNFLRRARPTIEHDQCQLSYENCLDIARQIAEGAYYLEQHAYVHRDLAARNCLVSASRTMPGQIVVKIGDFGLARMLSQQDYYRKTGEALLPVRWMAPESLLDAVFTSHSDIWSFGIVLWEIITLGQVPYSPLNNQQVISLITTTRGTLEKPMQCTQAFYELMLSCWNFVPENRMKFRDIDRRLTELLSDASKEQPSIWFSHDLSAPKARTVLDSVLSHIGPPSSLSYEGSDLGECRSSTSGCFSSMTESTSPTNQHHPNRPVPPYQLRLIDDTTSNDFVDDDYHSDIVARAL